MSTARFDLGSDPLVTLLSLGTNLRFGSVPLKLSWAALKKQVPFDMDMPLQVMDGGWRLYSLWEYAKTRDDEELAVRGLLIRIDSLF